MLLSFGCARPAPPAALRVALSSAPEALDPRFASSALAVRLSHLVAPPLCVIGDDLRPRLVLAQSITRIDDLTVDAKLRADLRFPRGGTLAASDVTFSFASVQDPALSSPHRPRLDVLKSVEVVDERTVRFHLRRPHAPFVLDVVCAIGIVSEQACSDPAPCRFHPVGAGAWQVGDVGVDRFTFKAVNARHDLAGRSGALHGDAEASSRGSGPLLADLDLRVMKDGTARLLAVVAGDVDVVASEVPPWDLQALPSSLSVHRVPGLGFSYLGLNARRLTEPQRQAIAKAVDVDALLSGRLRGFGRRASGLLPPDHWAKDPSLAPIARDLVGARALLQGERLRVRLLVTPDRLRRSMALALRSQLAEAGVDVDVVVRDWSVVYEELKAGRFDLVLAKWTPVAEPDLLTTVFHSRSIPSKDTPGGNRGAFVDVDVDQWLDAARAESDDAERRRLYGLVERRVQERAALVPLWFDDEVWIAGPRVSGLKPWPTGSLLPLQDVVVANP
ncbi:MAG: ABC transporter substrate-binding protein [Deltaproteobacteria bacterium]|nr:ABC transporter substrate-binding protein [Deltaproteobacteria bacterium]